MNDLTTQILTLINEEFYDSALYLAEYSFLHHSSPIFLTLILKSLQKLNHNDRIINLINSNKHLLKNHEIQRIYLTTLIKQKKENYEIEFDKLTLSADEEEGLYSRGRLRKESVICLLESDVRKDSVRVSLVRKAFFLDERNLEALFRIRFEKLESRSGFWRLVYGTDSTKSNNGIKDNNSIKSNVERTNNNIDRTNNNIDRTNNYVERKNNYVERTNNNVELTNNNGKVLNNKSQIHSTAPSPSQTKLYANLFSWSYNDIDPKKYGLSDDYLFFSPFTALKTAKHIFHTEPNYNLFKLSVFMMTNYPSSFISPLILGLYYLKNRKYKEAKRCFQESIQQERRYGIVYLYYGISLSCLKEGINAISCFKTAKDLMLGSFKPEFYLANEFSNINDETNAHFYFQKMLRKKRSVMTYISYSCFLFRNEMLDEMKKVLDEIGKMLGCMHENKGTCNCYLKEKACIHENKGTCSNCNAKEMECRNVKSNYECKNKKEYKNVYTILVFFYSLGVGKFKEGEEMARKMEKVDWRYYACNGYVSHLLNKRKEAVEFYSESIIMAKGRIGVLEELLRYGGDDEHYDLVDYAIDLFDAMELSSVFGIVI